MALLSLEMIEEIRRVTVLYADRERERLLKADEYARQMVRTTRDAVADMLRDRPSGMTLDDVLTRLVDTLSTGRGLAEVLVARMAREGLVTTSTPVDGAHDATGCRVTWVPGAVG